MITQSQAALGVLDGNETCARYYRALAARLGRLTNEDGGPLRIVGVTSSAPGEGVTTVAANLAITEAVSGRKSVLLVDANEQDASLARLFCCDECGPVPETVGQLFDGFIEPTSIEGLAVVTVGGIASQRSAISPHELREEIDLAKRDYDLVIVDLSPATGISPCFEWGPLLDGVLLVVEAERTSAQAALQVKTRLINSRTHLLGVVFNKRPRYVPNWLYRRL
jgi:Mrp family chromosome partitioning ATPase